MKIEWNKVTWYSKVAAVVVFVLTFILAFKLGMAYEAQRAGIDWGSDYGAQAVHKWLPEKQTATSSRADTPPAPTGGVAGAHCGGFIKDAPVCAAGFHCELTLSRPDTGGTCMAD